MTNNYSRTSNNPEELKYYSFMNSLERVENEWFIEFDSIAIKDCENTIFLDGYSIIESPIKASLITLRLNGEDKQRIFGGNNILEQLLDTWLMVRLGETGIQASYYDPNADYTTGPVEVNIEECKPLQSDSLENRKLLDKLDLSNFKCNKNKEEIETLFKDRLLNYNAEFVASYGVGQGSANSVCDLHGYPLMYFDMGGGFGWNWYTYRRTRRFIPSLTKIVILSHWDTDHFESANRNLNERMLNETWIAPIQTPLGPRQINFARKLFRRGNLILTDTSFRTPYGEIILCGGENKNNTGFAFHVELEHARYNSIKNVLLPGDAAYTHIDYDRNGEFDALIATHHGANFEEPNTVPIPSTKKSIVYSYGIRNRYNHPRMQTAILDHERVGWTNRRDISNTNIGIHDIDLRRRPPYFFFHWHDEETEYDLWPHQSFY